MTHADELLTALGITGVILNLRKYAFFTDTVEYLREVVRPSASRSTSRIHVPSAGRTPSPQQQIRVALVPISLSYVPPICLRLHCGRRALHTLLTKIGNPNTSAPSTWYSARHSTTCSQPFTTPRSSPCPYPACLTSCTGTQAAMKSAAYWYRTTRMASSNRRATPHVR